MLILYSKQVTYVACHYACVIMGAMASQITSVSMVCPTVCSGADQRKRQSSAPLAFVSGIHWSPVNSHHKRPGWRKMCPFDDVIMLYHQTFKCRSSLRFTFKKTRPFPFSTESCLQMAWWFGLTGTICGPIQYINASLAVYGCRLYRPYNFMIGIPTLLWQYHKTESAPKPHVMRVNSLYLREAYGVIHRN